MKQLLTAKDVQEITGTGESKAYSIIRQLNDELKEKGFLVITGKVNRKYFFERMGLETENTEI